MKMVSVCRIGRDEARDAKEAKEIAKARMGPGHKYTSTQRNSEGWSICFKRVTVLKTEEEIRKMITYLDEKVVAPDQSHYVREALVQRATALMWVLGEGTM